MGDKIEYFEMRLKRFTIRMKEVVDEIVKIENKWILRATTIEGATEDLKNVKSGIDKLFKESNEIEKLAKDEKVMELVKFRLKNANIKLTRALRGEWGE